MITYRTLLSEGKEVLQKAKIMDFEIDAWLLMEFVFQIDRARFFLEQNETVEEEKAETYRSLLAKRAKHIPVQQITHEAWFFGLPFYVNENVLIPRQDTEVLIEEVLSAVKKYSIQTPKILDMCTGSGCILLSLLANIEGAEGLGADLSEKALEVAQKNGSLLNLKAEWCLSNLFSHINGKYDIIVSNPPYIESAVIETLMEEVREHEPRMALDGKEDGLYFYREITKQAGVYLNAGGILAFEIGYNQGEAVSQMLKEEQYEEIKASCKSWPLEEVTHVFYHTLIKDPSKAFDGDYKEADYNQVMTTIDEFNKITETMYEKGYVMVSIYDMAKADADGNITEGEILLPEGKIPFVLSQDDVCYYHYMDGDGYASKLVVDENGKIRNEYIEDDGSVSVGDYDMVPLIDRFVEEHPDFSYRGAKGIVALTGYNGILGYRTDQSYETRPDDLDANKVEWLDAHPDFSLAKEREGAKKVADAMKAEGWLFASHTWGHQNVGQIGLETLQTDTRKFKDNVDPLIGGTDIIIFAFGTDLCGPEDYHGDKFEYLKGAGYNYFCNVDSSKYYVQIRERYFRQGRRNLDGYRMYYHPELLEDLFDVKSVFDSVRPTPVPPLA